MKPTYPNPRELGIDLPTPVRERRFNAGFRHALRGGQLDQVRYFRRSFRLGYRAAKLYLRELRRRQGILQFPLRARMRLRAVW
jgi:hypothetical protein